MKKTLTKILAFVGALAILGGVTIGIMQGVAPDKYKPSNWGHTAQAGDNGDDESGIVVTMVSENGIRVMSLEDGASLKDSVTVTATVTDVTARYRDVEFSYWWNMSPGSTALVVSDYVTMETEGNTATLTCLQPFPYAIILTATVTGTDVSGTYRLEYLRSLNGVQGYFNLSHALDDSHLLGLTVAYSDESQNNYVSMGSYLPTYGVGSVSGNIQLDSIELMLSMSNGTLVPKEKIAQTEYFLGYLCGRSHLTGNVTVRDSITITDFADKWAGYTFNLNVFDFFEFPSWDFETKYEDIQKYSAAALLEAFGEENAVVIVVQYHYSYVYEGKVVSTGSWFHEYSVDFGALTTDPSDVEIKDSNGNSDGYVFGAEA